MFTYNICPCIAFTREIQRSGAKARKDLDQNLRGIRTVEGIELD